MISSFTTTIVFTSCILFAATALPQEGAENSAAIQTDFALNWELNVLAAKVNGI